jgi:hypothetical protein
MSDQELCVILLKAGWLEKFTERENGRCCPFWTFLGGARAMFWRWMFLCFDLKTDENLGRLCRVMLGREKVPEEWADVFGDVGKTLGFYVSDLPEIFHGGDIDAVKCFTQFCVRWGPVGENGI